MAQFQRPGSTLNSTQPGYYRYPSISHGHVVFVSEDDLWTVPSSGGVARRLSSGLGKVSSTALSRDGKWLAFTSTEEGHAEVYVMPADGGEAQRLTHLGCETRVVGWSLEGEIVFASNHHHAFARLTDMYTIHPETHEIKRVLCGPATHIDFSELGQTVIARHGGTDLAYWKRYRGGRAGELWIDRSGHGQFEKLLKTDSNCARPFFCADRIVFVSDHEGVGQIYSVETDGSDMVRHTENRDFYTRGLAIDKTEIVYHAGGDLYVLDLASDEGARKLDVAYRSPRTQINRRFVTATPYLEDYGLDPSGETVVISARGKTFTFDTQQGPVRTHGQEGSTRSRLGRFLNDGSRIALVCDKLKPL